MAWTLLLFGVFGLTITTGLAQNEVYRDSDIDPRLFYNEDSRTTEKHASAAPITQCKQVKSKDEYKTVLIGVPPTQYRLEMPEYCLKLGICDKVINYPQDEANRVFAELRDLIMFQNDKMDALEELNITQRAGREEENVELCGNKMTIYPKAAVDVNGVWHLVLNKEDHPLQGFDVELCDGEECPCSDIVVFQPKFHARCVQKFMFIKMAVFYNSALSLKLLRVPSCCQCIAKK